MKIPFPVFALGVAWMCACADPVPDGEHEWKLPADEPKLKEAPGAELVTASCILCHSVDYISTQPKFSRDQWKATLTKMQQKFGAPLNPEKFDPLLDYLVTNYGK